jgi:hypothetical protein
MTAKTWERIGDAPRSPRAGLVTPTGQKPPCDNEGQMPRWPCSQSQAWLPRRPRPDLLTARRHQATGDRTNGDTDLPIGSAVSLTLTDLRDRTACLDVRERCILVVGSHQHDREPTKCRHGVRHRQLAVNCPGRLIALTLAVHRWPGSGTSRRPPRRFSGAESTEGADDPAVSDALPRRCCAFFSDCSHGSDVSGGRLQLVSAGTERRVRGPCAPPTFRRGAPTVSGRLSVSSAG